MVGGPRADTTGGSDAPLGSGGKWPSASTCVHGRYVGARTGYTRLCAHPAPGPRQAPPTQAPGSQFGDPTGQLDSRDSIYLSASPFSLRRSRGALAIQQLIPRKRSQSCGGGAVTSHPSPRSSLHQSGCVQTALPCSESLLSHIPTAPLWVRLVTCPLALGLSLPF